MDSGTIKIIIEILYRVLRTLFLPVFVWMCLTLNCTLITSLPWQWVGLVTRVRTAVRWMSPLFLTDLVLGFWGLHYNT